MSGTLKHCETAREGMRDQELIEKLEEMTREYFPISANLYCWNTEWKRICNTA